MSPASTFDLNGAVRALIEESREQKQDFAVHIAECNQRQQRIEEKLDAADQARNAQTRKIDENARLVDDGIRRIYELLWRVAIATIVMLVGVIGTLAFYLMTHPPRMATESYAATQHDLP